MPEDGGKAFRVIGFFFFLLGAGVILDSDAESIGFVLVACGTALFAWGALRAGGGRRTVSIHPTEGSERC